MGDSQRETSYSDLGPACDTANRRRRFFFVCTHAFQCYRFQDISDKGFRLSPPSSLDHECWQLHQSKGVSP